MESVSSAYHPQPVSEPAPLKILPVVLIFILLAAVGIGTGFVLSRKNTAAAPSGSTSAMIKTPTEAGTLDTKTFKDYAIGTLEEGGLGGEGTHKLIRPGGTSQTVYLISSLVDLNSFTGKKVEIYGQTIRAKSVGWLMDVGRIKVVE